MGSTQFIFLLLFGFRAGCIVGHGEVISREERETSNQENEAVKGPEENACDPRFYSVSLKHTMCLKSPTRTEEGVTEADKKMILDFHNEARGRVGDESGDTASNMQKMVWDEELAEMAQKWASNCQNFHDANENRVIPGKYSVGQNLAMFSYKVWKSALQIWYNEKYHFKYGVGPQGYRQAVGHYTQMIWANSSKIGCGYAVCNNSRHLYVCNYGSAGNIAQWRDPSAQFKPYALGPKGEACPDTFNKETGLCDCKGKVCFNGGILDPNTCTCTCKNVRWLSRNGNCDMNCARAHDTVRCASLGGSWSKGECSKFANLPYDYCPITCGWCPMTNGKYWDSSEIPLVIPPAFEKSPTAAPFNPRTTTIRIIEDGDIEDNSGSTSSGESESDSSESSEGEDDPLRCSEPDVAECGQPSTKYWGRPLCYSPYIQARCPAMCGQCAATQCIDYQGEIYELDETWITSYGRFTCTVNGVQHERGCMREGQFVAPNDSHSYDKGDYRWTCKCHVVGFSYQLFCSGLKLS